MTNTRRHEQEKRNRNKNNRWSAITDFSDELHSFFLPNSNFVRSKHNDERKKRTEGNTCTQHKSSYFFFRGFCYSNFSFKLSSVHIQSLHHPILIDDQVYVDELDQFLRLLLPMKIHSDYAQQFHHHQKLNHDIHALLDLHLLIEPISKSYISMIQNNE